MNNKELQAETEAQQSKNAEPLPSAPLVANPMLVVVQSIYDAHKKKLNNLKENRAKSEEEKWTDTEVKSVDEQIVLLASVLSDLYKYVLHYH